MAPVSQNFMHAIHDGDLTALKACIAERPQDLAESFRWGTGSGFALHYAAVCNKPKIIEYLVREQHMNVNRQDDVSSDWAPLHCAANARAYSAAAMLLSLGANPGRRNSSGQTTEEFCQEEFVQTLLPGNQEKIKHTALKAGIQKAAGAWTLNGTREIVRTSEPAGSGCRLIDIFNFETRCWRAIAKDLKDGGMSQNVMLFDDMEDNSVLRPAMEKLKELGGVVEDNEIERTRVIKMKNPAGLRLRAVS